MIISVNLEGTPRLAWIWVTWLEPPAFQVAYTSHHCFSPRNKKKKRTMIFKKKRKMIKILLMTLTCHCLTNRLNSKLSYGYLMSHSFWHLCLHFIFIIYWCFRIYFNWIQPAGTNLYSRGTYRLIVHGKFLLLSELNSQTPFFFKINLKSMWLETPSPKTEIGNKETCSNKCWHWKFIWKNIDKFCVGDSIRDLFLIFKKWNYNYQGITKPRIHQSSREI